MSVGGQGEARGVVAQHTGDGFHVDAGLQGEGGEGVTQCMKGDVVQSGLPQDLLVEVHYGVGVVHPACAGGGKHVRV